MVESIKELRRICQEGASNTYNEWIQRKFSIYLTKLLLYTSITANQISLLNILIGIVAGGFFVLGTRPWLTLVGTILLFFWSVLDCTDGEIARYRGTSNITGAYIDDLNHIIVDPYIFACLSFSLFRVFHNPLIFVLGFSASLSRLLITLVRANMYSCVIDTCLYSKHKFIKQLNLKEAKLTYGFRHRMSHLSVIYEILWSFYLGTGKILILLVASVIDIMIPNIQIASFKFTALYAFLVVYGILSPFGWIGLSSMIVRKKSCEALYFRLFKKDNEKI